MKEDKKRICTFHPLERKIQYKKKYFLKYIHINENVFQ